MSNNNIESNMDTFINFEFPILCKIPKSKQSILNYKIDPSPSINIDYPKFTFGFQHYVHANRDKLDITDKFIGKKKVYNVIDRYNLNIDNYDVDIAHMTKVYLDLDPKPLIINQDFYKLWEILHMFDLTDAKTIVSSHYGSGDGSFIQSLLYFREMYHGGKSDKYNICKDKEIDKLKDNLNDDFIKYYNKDKAKRVNITDKTIQSDFVTISCTGNWKYRNLKEQDTLKVFIHQLLNAIRSQKNKGSLVCQIYETYGVVTNKILYMLSELYNDIYLIKPFTGEAVSSEKFIICKEFNSTKQNLAIKQLNILLNIINKNDGKDYIVNIFPEFDLPLEYIEIIRKFSTDFSNRQLIIVNKIVDFIKQENYYGDYYSKSRDIQIKGSVHWIKNFLPKDYKINSKNLNSMINNLLQINKKRIDELNSKLVS